MSVGAAVFTVLRHHCYTVPASFTPTGAMTLGLKVVIGSTSDRITVGMVAVGGLSE